MEHQLNNCKNDPEQKKWKPTTEPYTNMPTTTETNAKRDFFFTFQNKNK